jgi:hypothetical protein
MSVKTLIAMFATVAASLPPTRWAAEKPAASRNALPAKAPCRGQ